MMAGKRKILFRHRAMDMGGTERVLLTILRELDPEKYEVVLLLNFPEGVFLSEVPPYVKVHSILPSRTSFSKNTFLNKFQLLWRRLRYYFFQKNPTGFYRKEGLMDAEVEVAFSHYMIPDILNSPNKKSKKVFWFHGDLRNFWLSEKKKQTLIQQMRAFDQGVFVSELSKKGLEAQWKVQLSNSLVIGNPLPVEEILKFGAENPTKDFGKINFISVGRLSKNKGFLDLLEAHRRLLAEGFQIKTLILGEGYLRAELEQKIKEFDLQKSFILGGFQKNPYAYIKRAGCFVLASYSEGFSLVVAEALLLNTPVIATDVGAVSEMLTHPEMGELIPPGEEFLYQAMRRFLLKNKEEMPPGVLDFGLEMKKQNEEIFNQIRKVLDS